MDLSELVTKVESLPAEAVSDIENRFHFHPSTAQSAEIHDALRAVFAGVAKQVVALIPGGREAALVLTKIEEAATWAHKAVALTDPAIPPGAAVGSPAVTQPPAVAEPPGEGAGDKAPEAAPVGGSDQASPPDATAGATDGAPVEAEAVAAVNPSEPGAGASS